MKGLDLDRVEIVKKRSDAFLMEVGQSIAQDNLAEYEAAESALQAGEDLAIPESADLGIRQMAGEFAGKQEALKRAGRRRKRLLSAGRIAALVFLCVLISGTLLVVCVDAFRIQLMDFLFEDHGEYMDVNVVPAGDLPKDVGEMIPEDWDGLFYPGWLPEGYELTEASSLGSLKELVFMSIEEPGKYISLSFMPDTAGNVLIDSEYTTTEEIEIGGKNAILYQQEETIGLLWLNSGYALNFFSTLSYDSLVRIAESIQYINLN